MFNSLLLVVKQIMNAIESSHDMRSNSDYILYYSGRSMNE
jgi:hypothetical protein